VPNVTQYFQGSHYVVNMIWWPQHNVCYQKHIICK